MTNFTWQPPATTHQLVSEGAFFPSDRKLPESYQPVFKHAQIRWLAEYLTETNFFFLSIFWSRAWRKRFGNKTRTVSVGVEKHGMSTWKQLKGLQKQHLLQVQAVFFLFFFKETLVIQNDRLQSIIKLQIKLIQSDNCQAQKLQLQTDIETNLSCYMEFNCFRLLCCYLWPQWNVTWCSLCVPAQQSGCLSLSLGKVLIFLFEQSHHSHREKSEVRPFETCWSSVCSSKNTTASAPVIPKNLLRYVASSVRKCIISLQWNSLKKQNNFVLLLYANKHQAKQPSAQIWTRSAG